MAKGWKLEPGRHALAARGVPTGRKSYVSSSVSKDKYREDSEQGRIARQNEHERLAKLINDVSTDAQKEVFASFESGDEYLFLQLFRTMTTEPVTPEKIDAALEVKVNSVEGDLSQLTPELVEYAQKKGWLDYLTEVEINEGMGKIKPQGLAGELAVEHQKREEAKKPKLELLDKDGNAFAILGKARKVAMANNMPWENIQKEATSGDYDHLLQTMMKYFDVE
jgi:hypothetical protein